MTKKTDNYDREREIKRKRELEDIGDNLGYDSKVEGIEKAGLTDEEGRVDESRRRDLDPENRAVDNNLGYTSKHTGIDAAEDRALGEAHVDEDLNYDNKHIAHNVKHGKKSEGIEEDLNFDKKYENRYLGNPSEDEGTMEKCVYDESKNTKVEIFDTQDEVLRRVCELKEQGISEKDMYLVAKREDDINVLRRNTDVEVNRAEIGSSDRSEERGFFAKFKDAITGRKRVGSAFNRMNICEEDRQRYQEEVNRGKIMLYVDADYTNEYDLVFKVDDDNRRYDTSAYTESASEIGKHHHERNEIGKRDLSGNIVRDDKDKL
jgi:hypothetical protein